ncbi:MAG TPA: DUF4331 domain-containing protein [Crinalium sp.]|jgi:hypothetical protein
MAIEPQAKPHGFMRRVPAWVKRVSLKRTLGLSAFALMLATAAFGVSAAISPPKLQASDHDDGDIDVRSRALSLTDLYLFREKDQNPGVATDDLILVMNTNPRSLARQQYFFSNNARYEIKLARVGNVDAGATGVPDLTLRFTFAPPVANNRQRVTLTVVDRNGRETPITRGANGNLVTTPITEASNPTLNRVRVNGQPITFFAGLREDPFFFDVEQYFRVRAALAGLGPVPQPLFRTPDKAIDFTKGYNVNSIVVRVPRKLLQGATNATAFDAWLTISIPDPRTGRFTQTEQLARPGINELLTSSRQSIYTAYNRTQPSRARNSVNSSIRADIKGVLQLLGNTPARADALLNALLPDVMRIDTTQPSGYATLSRQGNLIGGRKLLDDVIDISFTVLTNGAVTTDNVSYTGEPGNPAQGHQPLLTSFPYLAPPN